jgi:tetratricopeptide (TPR) repeat protein
MPAMKLGRPSRKLILVLALAGACVHAAPARAAGAEDKFALGTAAFTDGKLDEALKIFQEIWKTNKSYDVAVMLARTERNLEKHRDAADHYAYALANFPLSGEEELREEVKTELADVKKQIGTLRIRVPVKDATVKIGGAAVDAAALAQDIFVNKGKVVIEATAPGYQPEKKTLEVKPGTSEDVIITLQVERITPRSKVPAIVVGGVGFVGIVIGAALVGTSEGAKSEAHRLHDQIQATGGPTACRTPSEDCNKLRDAAANADALGNGGIAAFVLGGLAGAAALGYMLIPTRKPQTGKVAILPVAAPSTGGLLVSGSF